MRSVGLYDVVTGSAETGCRTPPLRALRPRPGDRALLHNSAVGREKVGSARYLHTNIVAAEWRSLADFYAGVFGCEEVPPQRDLSGDELERGTGVAGAAFRGVHLRLPGHGPGGPTLEIFQYQQLEERAPAAANRLGLAHLAFAVEDVEQARAEVIAWGGRSVGDIVTTRIDEHRSATWCYVTDPEGNIIELQRSAQG